MDFLYPPRPDKAISPGLIKWYEKRGWIAQLKKNGTCSLVGIDKTGKVDYWTRHGERHKAWAPHQEVTDFFSNFPDSYFVFELLHSKGGDFRDHAFVFDVVRYLGEDLIGSTLSERLDKLKNIRAWSSKVELAKTYDSSLTGLFESLESIGDNLNEGIVLKNPNGVLESCGREGLNSGWQVKCRRPTKNYGF